jgi:hypothetical protein
MCAAGLVEFALVVGDGQEDDWHADQRWEYLQNCV